MRSLINKSPAFVCAKVFAYTFQCSKMFDVRSIGKTGEETNRVSNIQTTDYLGVDQFTQNIAVGETSFDGNLLGFGTLFGWTFE